MILCYGAGVAPVGTDAWGWSHENNNTLRPEPAKVLAPTVTPDHRTSHAVNKHISHRSAIKETNQDSLVAASETGFYQWTRNPSIVSAAAIIRTFTSE